MAESWKSIKGHTGYAISDQGNVKRLGYTKLYSGGEVVEIPEKLLKLHINSNNLVVHFSYRTFLVKRLVAQSFLPNPENKQYVKTKNGNKLDCRSDNLEWCSASESAKQAIRDGKRKKPNPYSGIPIVCKEDGRQFPSIGSVATYLNLPRSHVTRSINQRVPILGKIYQRVK